MTTASATAVTYGHDAAIARFSVARYQKMIETGIVTSEDKVELLNTLAELQDQIVEAQGLSRRFLAEVEEKERGIQHDPDEQSAMLRRQVEVLERETANMEEVEFGDKVREFLGEGNRQYLTGLVLGGERVLILVDGSASMLADTVVNAVRRRLAEYVLHEGGDGPPERAVHRFLDAHDEAWERLQRFFDALSGEPGLDLSMATVAVRQLRGLIPG